MYSSMCVSVCTSESKNPIIHVYTGASACLFFNNDVLVHEFPHGDSKGWIVLHCILLYTLVPVLIWNKTPLLCNPPHFLPSCLPVKFSCWATFHISWSSLLSLAGAATSIIFVMTKDVLCQNKTFVVTNVSLLQQKFCRNKNMFVATKVLSRQAYFCRDQTRHTCLSRQNFCRDKNNTCGSFRQ